MFYNSYPYTDFHELNIDAFLKAVREAQEKITTLEEEFAKIEILTKDQIELMISQAIAVNNIKLANDLQKMHDDITSEYTNYVQYRINQLTSYVDSQDTHYNTLAQNYADNALSQANSYTDTKILDYNMMINPITGQYDDVRVVVDDIVNYFHMENALTAGEYDALELTAEDYDDYELTAYDYDFNGKVRLVPNP